MPFFSFPCWGQSHSSRHHWIYVACHFESSASHYGISLYTKSHVFSFAQVIFLLCFALYTFLSIKTHQHDNKLLNRADSPLNQISLGKISFTMCWIPTGLNLHSLRLMLHYFCCIFQQLIASGILTTCKGASKSKLDCTIMLTMLLGDTHNWLFVCGTL